MRKALALTGLLALLVGASMPAHAGTYKRHYAMASTPGIAFKINPADGDLGDENVANDVQDLTDEDPLGGTPADTYPFRGTPLNGQPHSALAGTPANAGFGGVTFEKGTFSGTTLRIKVVDTVGSAAGGVPVSWSACQRKGPLPVCGTNTEDISADGCTLPNETGRLSGFDANDDINVWIIANDSGGTFTDGCDSVATSGDVFLLTS